MAEPDREPVARAERVGWEEFRKGLRRRMRPGEHSIIVGSTGSGKSILARELLGLHPDRNWVILDAKRGLDPSLDVPGFRPVSRWPEARSAFRDWWGLVTGERPGPERVRLAVRARNDAEFLASGAVFARALETLRWKQKASRPTSVYVDEMQAIASPYREGGLNLGTRWIAPLLREIRFTGASVMTGTQYPTWVPKSAYRETTHRFLFDVESEDERDTLGKLGGDRKTVVPMLKSLRRHEFLYVYIHGGAGNRYLISKVDLPKST